MPTPARPKTAAPKTERRKKSVVSPLPAEAANDSPRVSRDDIALRAFAYYCERGCQDGADMDDWLRAERELLARPASAKAAAAR